MRRGADGLVIGEEGVDDGLRVGCVVGGDGDFHAVAGGEDHGFGDALARLQIGQRGGQRLLAEGQALAHLDGCGLVTHAGDQQLHGLNSRLPSRACAAQVMRGEAEHRDRHDGGLAAAPSGGGAQEDQRQVDAPGEERNGDLRLADPVGLQFDEGPGAAGDHGQRDEHEAERHGFGDQVVERAQRRAAGNRTCAASWLSARAPETGRAATRRR